MTKENKLSEIQELKESALQSGFKRVKNIEVIQKKLILLIKILRDKLKKIKTILIDQ